MGIVHNFNKALSLWFNSHDIPNLEFVEGEDFCFYVSENTVQWGMFDTPKVDNHFQQFFYEYGLKSEYNHPFFISLIHEVGHAMTMPAFSREEKDNDIAAKENNKSESSIETDYWYWELPTEFAANMWAINWINNNSVLAQELYDLCMNYLSEIFNNGDILNQLEDWVDCVKAGYYHPLYIEEED